MLKLNKIICTSLLLTIIFTFTLPITNIYAKTYTTAFVKKQVSYCGKNNVPSLAKQSSSSIIAWWNSLVTNRAKITKSNGLYPLYLEVKNRLKSGRFLMTNTSSDKVSLLVNSTAHGKVKLASVNTITFNNRKYRQYKQTSYNYSGILLRPINESYTISYGGCLPTSVSIIASGYNIYIGKYLINPASFVTKRWGSNTPSSYDSLKKKLGSIGLAAGNQYWTQLATKIEYYTKKRNSFNCTCKTWCLYHNWTLYGCNWI